MSFGYDPEEMKEAGKKTKSDSLGSILEKSPLSSGVTETKDYIVLWGKFHTQ